MICTVVLVRFFMGFFGEYDTSTCLNLHRNPYGLVAVIQRGCSSRGNLLDLGCYPFPFIFNLDFGQEGTPIFIVQEAIVLWAVFRLILYGLGDSVLYCKSYFTGRELLVADVPIRCFIALALHQMMCSSPQLQRLSSPLAMK